MVVDGSTRLLARCMLCILGSLVPSAVRLQAQVNMWLNMLMLDSPDASKA